MTSFAPRSFPCTSVTGQAYISIPMAIKRRIPPIACHPERSEGAAASLVLLACAFLAVAGCSHSDNPKTAISGAPPRAEFLVATQDSTFWITTEGAKVRARGAPLVLARYDGRFYELYVADDDRSFQDAMLVGLRLYRRDLQHGDSAVVFEDSVIPRVARQYLAAHPQAHRLAPDEDGDEEPPTQAMADLQVLDVHGPYLSYEYHVDVSQQNAPPWHATRRGVIDLRSGHPAQLSDLFPGNVASALVDSGRRELTSALDSLRGDSRQSARRAVATLSRARFDDRSFVLTVADSQVAVEFDVPQRGADVPDEVLPLDALRPPQPTWWSDVAREFPLAADDLDRWHREVDTSYDVLARYDSSAETARISLSSHSTEWPIRIVVAPVLHLFWLDQPPIDTGQRHALSRAFDEASLYDETTRTVRDKHRSRSPRLEFARARKGSARSQTFHHRV